MKAGKKIWVTYGILLLLGVALAINTGLLFFSGHPVLIVLGVLITLTIYVYMGVRVYRISKEQNQHMDAALSRLSFENAKTAAAFPMPFMVVDDLGEIRWYNDRFVAEVSENTGMVGEEIDEIFPTLSLQKACTSKGDEVRHKNRSFEVLGERVEKDGQITYILFFFENTHTKTLEEEYQTSRPAVLHLVIDNYEELFQDSKDSDKARISSKIEEILEKFTSENQGLLKRLNRDRYIIILNKGNLQKIIAGKFAILDEIHKVTLSDRYVVTLSIGVGMDGESLSDDDYMAKQGVEMALGRGGDQAAVKTASGYDFYGGLSQGIEKRTKVKTRVIASAMLDIIKQSDNCVVMGHRLADLDCFGSAVGLATAIRKLGKPCHVAINKKTNLVQPLLKKMEAQGYSDLFLNPSEAMPLITRKTLLFITDTHVVSMLESKEIYDRCEDHVIVIDHHRQMVGYINNALIFFHEPFASSASEMVTELIQYFGNASKPNELEAEALLAGITLDTKNFVLKTGVRTFEAAAYLRKQGASTVAVNI